MPYIFPLTPDQPPLKGGRYLSPEEEDLLRASTGEGLPVCEEDLLLQGEEDRPSPEEDPPHLEFEDPLLLEEYVLLPEAELLLLLLFPLLFLLLPSEEDYLLCPKHLRKPHQNTEVQHFEHIRE